MTSKKIFCYVDETGQDNLGEMFVVSVVVPEDRDKLLEYLEEIEVKTGKGKVKWGRANEEAEKLYKKAIKDKVLVEV